MNLYQYCGNDPVNYTDPLGLFDFDKNRGNFPGGFYFNSRAPLGETRSFFGGVFTGHVRVIQYPSRQGETGTFGVYTPYNPKPFMKQNGWGFLNDVYIKTMICMFENLGDGKYLLQVLISGALGGVIPFSKLSGKICFKSDNEELTIPWEKELLDAISGQLDFSNAGDWKDAKITDELLDLLYIYNTN